MPARITVYCRRRLAPGWLVRASREPDYLTAAEGAELDEDATAAAVGELAVADNGDITYAGAPRPIQVSRYPDAIVAESLDEAREQLEDADPKALTPLLAAVVEIVGFELGFQQAEGLGGVIAEQIARAIAFETDGIVDFYGDEWRVVDDGVER